MVTLPINQTSAHFGFRCELDGITWTFTFRWNHRSGQWCFDLGDSSGNLLITTIPIVPGFPLLDRWRNRTGTPAGDIRAFVTDGVTTDLAFEDLGRRVQLVYLSPSEVF